MTHRTHKPRAKVKWNTGERVHEAKKGKGSFRRRPKHRARAAE